MKKSLRYISRAVCALVFANSLMLGIAHAQSVTPQAESGMPEAEEAAQHDSLPLPPRYVFHCEKDTLEIEKLLKGNPGWRNLPDGERLTAIARALATRPAAEPTYLETDTVGSIEIDIHTFDPLSFVNTVWALSRTSRNGSDSWEAYAREYEKASRRNGEADGYLSRFLFPSEWLTDHTFRGEVEEMSGTYGQTLHEREKTIDFLTHNREDYAALADSATYEKVRMREMGYLKYPLRYLANNSFTKSQVKKGLQEGDLIIFYSTDRDLDSRDLGFVTFDEGVPYVIHLSPGEGKIWQETLPLDKYTVRNVRRIAGMRVFRLR